MALCLAFLVITLGAYTRLKDAGLGCPDWPGCYGHLDVPNTADEIARANSAFPERPVEAEKAWPEMIHRYFASTLGFIILLIAGTALVQRKTGNIPVKMSVFLLALVIFQGLLGMWTVTMMLRPIIVMAHLLGGFTVLCCLLWLYLDVSKRLDYHNNTALRGLIPLSMLAILVLVLQIALGGWTSSNYAATACTELPVCEGEWHNKLDFANAFHLWSPEAETYEFGILDYEARMTIHVMHRIGALITTLLLAYFAITLWLKSKDYFYKRFSVLLALVLLAQVALGISNVWWQLPLPVAVAHNGVGVILLAVLVAINFSLRIKPEQYE